MPHSLRAKLKNLQRKGELTDKDIDRIFKALEQEPCGDAISRDAVWDVMQELWGTSGELIDRLMALPSVNPQEPKTGHWVEENINEWSRKVFCSKCGCPSPFEHISNGDAYSASGYGVSNKTKYCPNCGARMESEDKV